MSETKKNKGLIRIILLDVLMIFILLINLLWIVFDWIFTISDVADFFFQNFPEFHNVYIHIHENFYYYDLIFVAIFVTELIIRWIIAVIRQTYYKWFFYPIIHFYDVLGCIPAGGWLIFRFLRIFSIIYRLNKLEIIDLTKTYIYKKLNKYYYILVEEISDRVVLNVLDGIQSEAVSGTPVVQKIIDEVFKPNKEVIINIIYQKITNIAKNAHNVHKNDLDTYIKLKVDKAFEQNQEVKIIEKVPFFGQGINNTLKTAIHNIVLSVVDSVISDLYDDNNKLKINEISGNVFDNFLSESENELNKVIEKIITESVQIIKERVKIQQWKLREIAVEEAKLSDVNESTKNKKMKEFEKQKREAVIKDPLFRKK
jgi:hypothetical protein